MYNASATLIAVNQAKETLKQWYDKILEKDIKMLERFVEGYKKVPIEFFSVEENRRVYPEVYTDFQNLINKDE